MDDNICDIGTANLTLVLADGTPQPVNSSMLGHVDGRGSRLRIEFRGGIVAICSEHEFFHEKKAFIGL